MSQDIFQAKMDQILERCSSVIWFADDVAVYGKTGQEHDRNLHHLMRTVSRFGLQFNSDKCSIEKTQIQFFGLFFHHQGAQPDPGTVDAIQSLPDLKNFCELRKAPGIITNMGPFILKLSNLTAPLRELVTSEQLEWTTNPTTVRLSKRSRTPSAKRPV